MSAHCDCDEEDREPIQKEVSPCQAEESAWITECGNCWGLISA